MVFRLLTCLILFSLPLKGAPQLFFDTPTMEVLRERVKTSPYREMLEAHRRRGEELASGERLRHHVCEMAVNRSFLFIATGEETMAEEARKLVEEVMLFEEGSSLWANPRVKGLSLYNMARCVAMSLDFCSKSLAWDPEFQNEVRSQLRRQSDVILEHGGAEQNRSAASNWQAIRFAAAGMVELLLNEQGRRKHLERCHAMVVRYLEANLGDGPRNPGWNSEGLGYSFYTWSFLGPYGIAAQRAGLPPFSELNGAVPYTLWTHFAATAFLPGGLPGRLGVRGDFVDDNAGARGEGTYGLAFHYVPKELHGGLRWVYDRLIGYKGDGHYDNERNGSIWSILYYPSDVPPWPPLGSQKWRDMLLWEEGNGLYTFRHRYGDTKDVVVQFSTRQRRAGGHWGPSMGGYRIIGFGDAWAVGGGRYGRRERGSDLYWRSQNTLYPLHPEDLLRPQQRTGRLIAPPQPWQGGGGQLSVFMESNNFDVTAYRRDIAVDFHGDGAMTMILKDSSRNGLYWQHNALEDHRFEILADGFLQHSPHSEATLKATFLKPSAPLEFFTGRRKRGSHYGIHGRYVHENRWITAKLPKGGALVVFTLKEGTHPEVTLLASGEIQVGNKTYAIGVWD